MTLKQFFSQMLPEALALKVDRVRLNSDVILYLTSRRKRGVCPYCAQASRRFHSRYTRDVRDLPCIARSVRLKLSVRRFRCANEACAKRTFAERFEGLLKPYARFTNRLQEVLQQVGLKVGAEPGAKLLAGFLLRVSPDTLLCCVHELPLAEKACPKRVSIDDFAFCRGISYGTIITDLEQGEPVKLLPSRDAGVIESWLAQHPQIELVARDRSKEYALATTRGTPQAVQVMDRWHVLKNLREAVEKEIGERLNSISKVFETRGLLGKPVPRSRRECQAQALALQKRQKQYKQPEFGVR